MIRPRDRRENVIGEPKYTANLDNSDTGIGLNILEDDVTYPAAGGYACDAIGLQTIRRRYSQILARLIAMCGGQKAKDGGNSPAPQNPKAAKPARSQAEPFSGVRRTIFQASREPRLQLAKADAVRLQRDVLRSMVRNRRGR